MMGQSQPSIGNALMPTRNVVLTEHQTAFVERLVESDRYQIASEVCVKACDSSVPNHAVSRVMHCDA
jgi:uncharacterized protein (DUF1330 family)